MTKDLDYLFYPKSIALIGSLRGLWFGASVVLSQLGSFGFQGKMCAVNPYFESDSFQGVKVYPDVGKIEDDVDLAVVMTSRDVVPQLVRECGEKGVKAMVIVSDGFAERDEQGAMLQKEVVKIAKSKGIRFLGPNTVGVVNTAVNLITTPYPTLYTKIKEGSIAICGQTGLIGPQAIPLEDMRYGISKICDFGNKADVNEVDMLDYLGHDPKTKVIAMHLEDIKDGRRFLAKAKEVVVEKPVLVLKGGRTAEGAKAAASHTGSLMGEDKVCGSAFRQAGVIRVFTLNELFDLAKMLAYQPLPAGNRLALITITGGGGVMGVDAAVEAGLKVAQYSENTTLRLAQLFPGLGANPTDLGPSLAVAPSPDLYQDVIKSVIEDEGVDCAVIILYSFMALMPQAFIEVLKDAKERLSKPIAIWPYGTNISHIVELTRLLEDSEIPVYSQVEDAVKALGVAFRYSQMRARFQ